MTERLGKPKELAAAYLGEAIGKNSRFSIQRLGTVFLFYSLAGMGSLFFLPFTSILSVMLMLSGILAPVAGAIKALGFLAGIEVPWVMFQIGSSSLHPLFMFPVSGVVGLLLFAGGRGLWKLTLRYIRLLGQKKRKLEEQ